VTRFNPDGTVDTTFGTGGRTPGVPVGAPADHTAALLVQGDGSLVVGGARYLGTQPGKPRYNLLVTRFTAGGALDTGFGTQGVVTALPTLSARVRDLAALPDGRIVAAGFVDDGTNLNRADAAAIRLLPDGTLDPSFGVNGVFRSGQAGDDSANVVSVLPDSGILLGGYTFGSTAVTRGFQLTRLLADGSRDPGFGVGGQVLTPLAVSGVIAAGSITSLALLPDGKVLASGYGGLARYLPGGVPVAVANAAPTANFAADGTSTVRFTGATDPSASDAAAGFRYSYDFNNDGDFADADLGEADGVADPSRPLPFTAPGAYTVRGRIIDKDGGFTDYTTRVLIRGVAGRRVFYNHSAFDGSDANANTSDDNAIAPDKSALLAGADATASFANVTGFDKGLNGVMVDIAGLPDDAALTADDFDFGAAGAPVSITVRRGAGVNGSDRVTLVWRDYNPLDTSPLPHAVANGWLTVTVRANAHTGLSQSDVFSFGNLIGETGDGGGAAGWRVSALDLGAVKRALNGVAPLSSSVDVNHDGKVNALDLGILKRNLNRSLPPPNQAPAAPAATGAVPAAPPAADAAAAPPRRIADDLLQ